MRALVVATLIATLLAAAPAPAQVPAATRDPATLAELTRAAAAEGTLNVAWGDVYGGAAGAQRIQDGIEKKYGVKLAISYSPVPNGAQYLNSLIQEIRAGQTPTSDVMFQLQDAASAAYAQPVDYRRYLPGLPADVMYYDRRSVVAVNVINAFEYNTKLVPAGKVPKTLADLLKPEWKGRIATSPYEANQVTFLALPNVLGHDGATAFLTAFSKQLGGIMTCGESSRVVSGEFLIFGYDCGDYSVRLLQRRGLAIGAIYPQEGTAIRAFAPAIPLGAAHPNAARLFVTFLLTREGQDILWDVMAADNARLPGSHMAKIIADARRAGVHFVDNYGIDVQHPELDAYQKEFSRILNAAQ